MKSILRFAAVLCLVTRSLHAQDPVLDRFLHDSALQDSVIAAIVPSHTLMSKLINKIADNRPLNEMVVQHLTRLLKEKAAAGDEHSHSSHQMTSQYAGDEAREIKALSRDEIKELEEGEGMGLAMAAELNHYPGPRHVLDLKEQLQLSDRQTKAVQGIFDHMHTNAVSVGRELVQEERALDRAFASKSMTPTKLRHLTGRTAELRGQLRTIHLAAHLETKAVLSSQQAARYDRLRGYSSPAPE